MAVRFSIWRTRFFAEGLLGMGFLAIRFKSRAYSPPSRRGQ
jgi:hypothetical protein